jgi:hypothetical protein
VKKPPLARTATCGLLALVCLVAIQSGVQSQSQARPTCSVEHLRTDVSSDVTPIAIRKHAFSVGASASSALTVENRSPVSIVAAQVVAEYYDERDEPLGNVVMQAVTESARNFRALGVASPKLLARSIKSGEIFVIGGIGAFALPRCPARSNVTMVSLQFADGTSFSWSRPDWEVGPFPWKLKIGTLPGCLEKTGANDVVLTLKLDAAGHVVSAMFAGSTGWAEIQRCVDQEAVAWEFKPALRGGNPTPTRLTLLLRLDPKSAADIRRPLTVMDVVPGNSGSKWLTIYAGIPLR